MHEILPALVLLDNIVVAEERIDKQEQVASVDMLEELVGLLASAVARLEEVLVEQLVEYLLDFERGRNILVDIEPMEGHNGTQGSQEELGLKEYCT